MSLAPCWSLDLDPSHQIFHFHGTDTLSRIGSSLKSLGDINGDGYDDIAFNSKSPQGTYIFLGGNPVDSFPDYFLHGPGLIGDFADYDGDGVSDLITSETGKVFFYKGHGSYLESEASDSLIGPSGIGNYGYLMSTGDIDNDNITDILVCGDVPGNGPKAIYYSNPFAGDKTPDWEYSIIGYSHQMYSIGVIDFNGDNVNDFFIGLIADLNPLGYVYIFLGSHLASQPDIVISHPVELADLLNPRYFADGVFSLGDINGDNWSDLGVLFLNYPLVYCGGPTADTLYDYQLLGTCGYMANAGDVNGDGHDDLVIGGSETMDGSVILYLGGPQFDVKRDGEIYRSDLPPLFLEKIGWRVSSAGDFNGDNIDDLLFSCQNFAYGKPWDVFIFSGGTDIVSGIEDNSETLLPDKISLHQNCPNPFNSTTIIEFDIPKRMHVHLTIYNILGEEVKTLINAELPANNYQIKWEGATNDGKIAPSGAYIYELRALGQSISRKMILMK
jgi:hypothetical protein